MTTIKSYTDLEQSKVLAEILPLESADMRYHTVSHYNTYPCDEIVYTVEFGRVSGKDIPCWSLAALLGVLPTSLNTSSDGKWNAMIPRDGKMMYVNKDNPVDACYEMVIKLHEQNLL